MVGASRESLVREEESLVRGEESERKKEHKWATALTGNPPHYPVPTSLPTLHLAHSSPNRTKERDVAAASAAAAHLPSQVPTSSLVQIRVENSPPRPSPGLTGMDWSLQRMTTAGLAVWEDESRPCQNRVTPMILVSPSHLTRRGPDRDKRPWISGSHLCP
jgi:hypothetical protein